MNRAKRLPIEHCALHPLQRGSRKPVPSNGIIDLMEIYGPVVSMLVRRVENQRYEILHRADIWVAAQALGIAEVEAVVLEGVGDAEASRLVRVGAATDPISSARHLLQSIRRETPASGRRAMQVVAHREGISRSTAAHRIRLLRLPEVIQDAVRVGALGEAQARALVRVKNEEQQARLAGMMIERRLSARAAERLVKESLQPTSRETSQDTDPDVARLERRAGEALGCRVRIDSSQETVVIHYAGRHDVLEGVLERLGIAD